MQRNALVSLAVAAALVAAGGYGTYQFGVRRGMAQAGAALKRVTPAFGALRGRIFLGRRTDRRHRVLRMRIRGTAAPPRLSFTRSPGR